MSYLALENGSLHYQLLASRGESSKASPTVVFLHGLVMDNLSSWFFTMANPVSQIARVLLYDLKGHGFSDRPKTRYAIEDHVCDLKSLLDAETEGQPVILVGNSFGGLLALTFAMRHPDKVSGLLLVDAQINDVNWRSMMLASFRLEGEARDQMIGLNFQNWLGRSSVRKSNRLAKNAHELIYETSLVEDLRASALVREGDLEKISMPCFAVYGEHSDILSTAFQLQRLIPKFDLRVFADCSHSVLWEKTDEVREWMLNSVALLLEGSAHGTSKKRLHVREELC